MLLAYRFRLLLLIVPVALVLALTACAPHPGAGNWQADAENAMKISRINVVFEGTADFYTPGREDSIRRCFWAAIEERSLQFQCVHSDNTDIKETYQFFVSPTGKAKLKQNEQLIGVFNKIPYQADNEKQSSSKKKLEQK